VRQDSAAFNLVLCPRYVRVAGFASAICLAATVLSFVAAASGGDETPGSRPAARKTTFASISARADAARDSNHLQEAKPLYRKALALRPGWAEGWWSLGTIAYDENSYTEAVRAFRKVTVLAPANGNAYVMLGLSEFELDNDCLALQHLEKGASLGLSENVELRRVALYHEAVVLQRLGKFQAAQQTLEQLCLQGVQSEDLIRTLGMVLLRLQSRTPPVPGSVDSEVVTRVGHAGCLAGQKKFDEGRTELSALASQHPDYPNIHYAFGLFLEEADDVPAAVAEFKIEIEHNPGNIVSLLQIAAALYKTDSSKGIPYAEDAIKLAPQQPFAHYLLGLLLLDTDDYQGAIPHLEIARQAFPREYRIYLALGTAYSRAGRKLEAAKARATFTRLTKEGKKTASAGEPTPPSAAPGRIPVGDLLAPPK
jgi:tetratricopeptide (TPR) repeat protein